MHYPRFAPWRHLLSPSEIFELPCYIAFVASQADFRFLSLAPSYNSDKIPVERPLSMSSPRLTTCGLIR